MTRKSKCKTNVKRYAQARKKNLPFLFWVVSILIIFASFLISMYLISDSSEEKEVVVKDTHQTFIQTLSVHAKQLQREKGILPSIIIAQAILESDWGESELGAKYHNLFGRKSYGQEDKVNLVTKEYEEGQWIEIKSDFKVYPDWNASMDDHVALLENGVTWNPQLYHDALKAKDYKEAATALQTAGYATDPTYADKLIEVIETNQLSQYDQTTGDDS